MSFPLTYNGSVYIIPTPNEVGWGTNLDDFFVAIAAGSLQKTGGLFTLSAETDFGSSFGLKSLSYKSRTSNVASTGILRLANNSDAVSWRNAANSGDLPLTVNASDQLLYDGNQVLTGTGPANYVSSITGIANQVIASAATGPVTLSLPQSINSTANVQFGTLGLGAANATSAILTLTSTALGFLPPRMDTTQRDAIAAPATGLFIFNTSTSVYNYYNGTLWVAIAAGGTINTGSQYQLAYYAANGTTLSPLTLLTATRALASDSNGLPVASVVTATELSYLQGASSNIQMNIDSRVSAAGATMTGPLTISPSSGLFSLLLSSAIGNQFRVTSSFAGNTWNSGRIGPLGLIMNWEPTGNGLAGDYIGLVNSGYKNSLGNQDEFAEIGSVLIDGTVGNETSRMMFSLRGAGDSFLSNQVLFSITPITNTGSILRFGPGEDVVDTAPTIGGGYLWSAATNQAGLSAGAQPTAADSYTARSTSATLIKLGITSGQAITFFSDTGLTGGSPYTPTQRVEINSGSFQAFVPAFITPTSNQLTLGTTRTVIINAPTPASTDRTWTIPDISSDGTFMALQGSQTVSGAKTYASSALRLQENGGSDVVTIAVASLATSLTYTIPDAGTNASFVMTEGAQTLNGIKTFSAQTTMSAGLQTGSTIVSDTDNTDDLGTTSINFRNLYMKGDVVVGSTTAIDLSSTGTVAIRGTDTNNSASAGFVGERISSSVVEQSAPTSGQYGDVTSISLTAGDWDISINFVLSANGATSTNLVVGTSANSGNTSSGLTQGDNRSDTTPPAAGQCSVAIPAYRVSLGGSITYYLKALVVYTVATPLISARISARRIR